MTTFTPGPWTVSDNHGKRYIEPVGDNEPVAMICRGHADAYSANAHLIAAAPEMLAALQDILSGWKYIRSTHGDLRGVGWDRAEGKAVKAISKALGSVDDECPHRGRWPDGFCVECGSNLNEG